MAIIVAKKPMLQMQVCRPYNIATIASIFKNSTNLLDNDVDPTLKIVDFVTRQAHTTTPTPIPTTIAIFSSTSFFAPVFHGPTSALSTISTLHPQYIAAL